MPFQYNVGFRGQITSKDLNDKVKLMLGNNVLLSGFQVTPGTNGAVLVSPGSAVIEGCFILEETDTRSITLPTSNVIGGQTYKLYLEYIHGSDSVATACNLKSALDSVILASNTIVLAEVFRPYQAIAVTSGDVAQTPSFKPLSEISEQIAVMNSQFEGNGIAYGTVQPVSGWWFEKIV